MNYRLSTLPAIVTIVFAPLLTGADQPLVAWGDNTFSQTTIPPDLTNVVSVSAGGAHNLALKADGTVSVWGANTSGQLNIPSGLTNVISISAGAFHSVAVKADGKVVAWGFPQVLAFAPPPATLTDVTAVAAGTVASLALKRDGTVVMWGQDSTAVSATRSLQNITAIAAGRGHYVALKSDGTVAAWQGLFGRDPRLITIPNGLNTVIAISAHGGGSHTLALQQDGVVVAWGDNQYGQSTVPVGLDNVVAISAGITHSLALKRDGTVVAWGDNTKGQVDTPTDLKQVSVVAAGGNHSLVLKGSSTVYLGGAGLDGAYIQDQVQALLAQGVQNVSAGTVPRGIINLAALDLLADVTNSVLLLRNRLVVDVRGDVIDWAAQIEQVPPASSGGQKMAINLIGYSYGFTYCRTDRCLRG